MNRAVFCIFLLGLSVLASAQSVNFSSSDLPIVIINTGGAFISDEPKVLVNMGMIYNGPGVKNNVTDPFNHYNAKVGIEVRGSSSQSFPKKQYSIELRNSAGVDIKQSLLGMPEEGDWILFGPYNDKSLVRDALAYRLARSMGRYASRQKFVELVIDGDYKGVYVLLEKIKRGVGRVDIADLDPDENTGDDLTGGYILKIDKTSGGNGSAGFTSAFPPLNRQGIQTIYFQYEYPKGDEISEPQKKYISDYMRAFETAMNSTSFLDPETGYKKHINISSFVDFFIMNEVSKNPDAYRLSTFMYKEKDSDGGKLHMGPVWDFNLGFGNVNYCTNSSPSGFVFEFNTICPGDFWLVPSWWTRMWADPDFRALLYARWSSLRQGAFETSKVIGYIDSVATVLNNGPQQRNFQKWPVLGKYIWPNPPDFAFLTTYESEVNWLKTWVTQRLSYLDQRLEVTISGVEDDDPQLLSVKPYPNPIDDEINFEYTISEPGYVAIIVRDALGREAGRVEEHHNSAGTFTSSTSMASLSSGLYFYSMEFNGRARVQGHLSKR